jgi:hypothetical protein
VNGSTNTAQTARIDVLTCICFVSVKHILRGDAAFVLPLAPLPETATLYTLPEL